MQGETVEVGLVVPGVDLAAIAARVRLPYVVYRQSPLSLAIVELDRYASVGHERRQADRHRMNVAHLSPHHLCKLQTVATGDTWLIEEDPEERGPKLVVHDRGTSSLFASAERSWGYQ